MGKDLKGLFLTCFSHRILVYVSADRLGPVIRQDCALSNGKGSVLVSFHVLFLYQKAEKSHFFDVMWYLNCAVTD